MSNKSVVDVLPTKKFFIDSITRDITLEKSITDLIDNSIDGAKRYIENDDYKGYFIKIRFNKKEFIIEDNCGGISIDYAKRYAFRFGNSEDNLKNYSSSGFGIGMKRAFFKIGKNIIVLSTTIDFKCKVNLDVNKWIKEKAWEIVVQSKRRENRRNNIEGTKIEITELNKTILEKFNNKNFEHRLRTLIEKEYRDYISKGLKIIINQIELNKENINESEIYFENDKMEDVEVNICIKKGESSIEDSGWYINLNDKFVVMADKTTLTGWGIESDKGLSSQKYSTDFYKFRGYVYAKASNPMSLPFTTTKDGVDKDSKQYEFILRKMIEGVQSSRDKFKENDIVNIQYKKPRDEVEMLKKYFNVKTAKKVGVRIYNEYLENMENKY